MAVRIHRFGWVAFLAVVTTLTLQLGQTRAQTLNEGWSVLEGKFRGGPYNLTRDFLKGKRVDPNDKEHLEAIDLLAKTYTYGVYLQKLELQPDGIRKDYAAFERSVDSDILKAKDPQAIQTFKEIFRDRVRVHASEVIQFDRALPIHKLHNARVLAEIAKLGQAELADTLITVLQDSKQTDGVRFWMLRGMATLLPQLQLPQQAKCAEALVELLGKMKRPGKSATPEEIDGLRYFRREAIRALAKTHTPSINDKVRPALVLARFAGNDESIQPPPRIDERVEAAIGLARMQSPPNDKEYQADYAAGQIAKCLGAMAQAAEVERAHRESRIHPWRLLAAQLRDALEQLKKNNGKNKYVVEMADRGAQMLKQVMNGDQINANEQTWWNSPQSDPPTKELFQGSPDSVVKPGLPSDEGVEK